MLRQERLKLLKRHLVRVLPSVALKEEQLLLPSRCQTAASAARGSRVATAAESVFIWPGLLAADCEETNSFSAFVVLRGSVGLTGGGMFFLEAPRRSDRTSRVVFLALLSESSGGQHTTFS